MNDRSPLSTLPDPNKTAATWLAWTQGGYFLITGFWPLIHIESFQSVTGRKTDHLVTELEADYWLVMTVGVLVVAIAITLVTTAWRHTFSVEIAVLAITSSVGLIGLDVTYVMRHVILPIYLADAAVECIFVLGWFIVLIRRPQDGRH